jgi:hypothetical protein
MAISCSGYFFGGLTGPGSLTHAPEVPVNIWQMQGPLQGLVALHVPVQVGSRLGFFCNCRAETVPAQRTAMIIAANEKFWMVFLMICPSFQLQVRMKGLPRPATSRRMRRVLGAMNKTDCPFPWGRYRGSPCGKVWWRCSRRHRWQSPWHRSATAALKQFRRRERQ